MSFPRVRIKGPDWVTEPSFSCSQFEMVTSTAVADAKGSEGWSKRGNGWRYLWMRIYCSPKQRQKVKHPRDKRFLDWPYPRTKIVRGKAGNTSWPIQRWVKVFRWGCTPMQMRSTPIRSNTQKHNQFVSTICQQRPSSLDAYPVCQLAPLHVAGSAGWALEVTAGAWVWKKRWCNCYLTSPIRPQVFGSILRPLERIVILDSSPEYPAGHVTLQVSPGRAAWAVQIRREADIDLRLQIIPKTYQKKSIIFWIINLMKTWIPHTATSSEVHEAIAGVWPNV